MSFHPAGHVLGSAQICVAANGHARGRVGRLQGCRRPDLRAVRAGPVRRLHHRGDVRACRCSAMAIRAAEIAKLLRSVELFPERAHLVGAYSLGKAQRVIALIREAGYDKPIYLHGAMESITRYYVSRGIDLGELRAGDRRRQQGRARGRRSRSARRPRCRIAGRGVSPIRSRPSRRAGCGCARGRASAASSCRW